MDGTFVIDNSVVMAWCFADEDGAYADAVLDRLSSHTAVVPIIWPLEVVNVLLAAERRQRLKPADSVRFLTLLSALPIVVDPDHGGQKTMMKDLLVLGRERALSSYDAAYLDLAMKNDCPIATLDKRLLESARAVDVPVI